jgi:hypothetical protein
MNEGTMLSLTKLIDGGGTAFERDLFASLRADQPPGGSRARVAESLGIQIPPTLSEASGSFDVVRVPPASRAAAAVGAAPRLTARLASVGKYTLIGLVAGLGSLRAGPVATQEATGEARAPLADTPAHDTQGRSSAAPSTPPEHDPLELSPKALLSAPSVTLPGQRSVKPHSKSKQQPQRRAESPLMSEVKQLDAARGALHASAPEAALRRLDEYDARFPEGELALEATVLRVHALSGSGRHAAALRLARHALSQPGSERYRAELQGISSGQRQAGAIGSPRDIEGAR